MTIKKGFDLYACDRADEAHKGGKAPQVYMQPDESAAKEWEHFEYIDEHGVALFTDLCPECAEKRRHLARAHAEEMTAFVNEGR